MSSRRGIVLCAALALLAIAIAEQPAAAQADQEALLGRIRAAIEARGGGHYVTPLPGSRSAVIAVDTSSALYFYLERGSIRGSAIDEFYAARDSGDMEGAYNAFLGSALMVLRSTDYGWNGLGTPMTTESGAEIKDVLFKDVGGVFARVTDIGAAEIEDYMEMLEIVAVALEAGS